MRSPEAKRSTLILVAGLVWTIVGLGLIGVAAGWLWRSGVSVWLPGLAGVVAGLIAYRFGFLRLVRANLDRLQEQSPGKERVCIFAFQNWRSYIIIVVMMLLGYTLRHLPVPKVYLAPVYLTIGLGLFLSSWHYYTSR